MNRVIRHMSTQKKFLDETFPEELALVLEDDWWVDSAEMNWSCFYNELAPKNHIEPDEPVKAYLLALLRWSDGAVVKDVVFDDEKISIIFENNWKVSISLKNKEESLFCLTGVSSMGNDSKWSVTYENGEFYHSQP